MQPYQYQPGAPNMGYPQGQMPMPGMLTMPGMQQVPGMPPAPGMYPGSTQQPGMTGKVMPQMPTQPMPAGYVQSGPYMPPTVPQQYNMQDPYMMALRQRFDSVDLDRSGSIEYQEIHKLFSNPADPIEYNCARMIISIFSTTGAISFQQFIECDRFLKSIDSQFMAADRNKNGKVELSEFLAAMKISFPQFDNQNLTNVFKRFSKDPSRQCLTYSEFLTTVVFLTLIKMKFAGWDTANTGRINFDIQTFLISLLWFV